MNNATWHDSQNEMTPPRPTFWGWFRVLARGGLLLGVITICLGILVLLRLIERPFYGANRPWTPHITRFVCRASIGILGIEHRVHGKPLNGGEAIVANHSSWLDIFVLNACAPLYFVSKAEVANWPGIGVLARATGTVFIERRMTQARDHVAQLKHRLAVGHRLLLFPEGTTSDSRRVLPFRPTLFAALMEARDVVIQPVSVIYHAPAARDRRFYGWWGDMALGPSLLAVLAQSPQGRVEIWFHQGLRAKDYPDRKALSRAAETIIAAQVERYLANRGP